MAQVAIGTAPVQVTQFLTGAALLTNNGPGIIYLDESSNLDSASAGTVLFPRQSVTVSQGRALYAVSDAGAALGIQYGAGMTVSPVVSVDGAVNVTGAVDATILGAVDVTGSVDATFTGPVTIDEVTSPVTAVGATDTLIQLSNFFLNTPHTVSNLGKYATLILWLDPAKSAHSFGGNVLTVNWLDGNGATIFGEKFGIDSANPNYYLLRLAIKGEGAELVLTGVANAGGLSVYASTALLPEAIQLGGNTSPDPLIGNVANKVVSLNAGASTVWQPTMLSGRAHLSIGVNAAVPGNGLAVFMACDYGNGAPQLIMTDALVDTVTNRGLNKSIIIPRNTTRFNLFNLSGVNIANITMALTMEGK